MIIEVDRYGPFRLHPEFLAPYRRVRLHRVAHPLPLLGVALGWGQGSARLLLKLTAIAIGAGRSIIAEVIGLIDQSGLHYPRCRFRQAERKDLGPIDVVVRKCYELIREKTIRVIFLMRLDDYKGRTGLLRGAVDSVEKALGRALRE